MKLHLTRPQAIATMVLVALMWSIAGLVTRQLEAARSFEVTFWRSAATAVSLPLVIWALQGRAAWRQVAWRSRLLWVSGLCWSTMFTAFMVALTLTSVANVLIVMALGPLFTALLAWAVLRQALPLRTWAAVVAAGAGIAYMYAPQLQAGGSMLGSLVALAVPVAGAVQWTLTQALQRRQNAEATQDAAPDLVPAVFIGACISSVLTLTLAWPLSASGRDVAWLSLLGLVQLAIPCALSVVCARVLRGAEVSLLALLEILFGIGLVWAFANEPVTARVLVGGGLVVGALAVHELLGLRAGAKRVDARQANARQVNA
jgi:drug/metabolite transporter (DMT)-like permease